MKRGENIQKELHKYILLLVTSFVCMFILFGCGNNHENIIGFDENSSDEQLATLIDFGREQFLEYDYKKMMEKIGGEDFPDLQADYDVEYSEKWYEPEKKTAWVFGTFNNFQSDALSDFSDATRNNVKAQELFEKLKSMQNRIRGNVFEYQKDEWRIFVKVQIPDKNKLQVSDNKNNKYTIELTNEGRQVDIDGKIIFAEGSITGTSGTVESQASGIVVESLNHSRSGDEVEVYGSITNHTSSTVRFVKVKIIMKNSGGDVIDTDSVYACGDEGLDPGETTKFNCYMQYDTRAKDFDAEVYDYD